MVSLAFEEQTYGDSDLSVMVVCHSHVPPVPLTRHNAQVYVAWIIAVSYLCDGVSRQVSDLVRVALDNTRVENDGRISWYAALPSGQHLLVVRARELERGDPRCYFLRLIRAAGHEMTRVLSSELGTGREFEEALQEMCDRLPFDELLHNLRTNALVPVELLRAALRRRAVAGGE